MAEAQAHKIGHLLLTEDLAEETNDDYNLLDKFSCRLVSEYFRREEHEKMKGFADLLDNMTELMFFKNLRISKECFQHLERIINIDGDPVGIAPGRKQLEKKTIIYIGLWYLSNSCSIREIAALFGVSESTTYGAIWKVVKSLVQLSSTVIRWPNEAEIEDTAARFSELSGLSGVVGAVDGCHIRISPPKEFQADYLDRTMKHSMNLMAICDSFMKITFMYAGFPGSAHDQRVLSYSPVWQYLSSPGRNDFFPSSYYHIIGDSAFAVMEHVMVPYKDLGNLTLQQLNFNKKLSQARRIIENCFALLKGRFRRLKYVNAEIERVPDIINACCVLHNLALQFPDLENVSEREVTFSGDDTDPAAAEGFLPRQSDQAGKLKRDQIAAKVARRNAN